jgi:hypothetical protein
MKMMNIPYHSNRNPKILNRDAQIGPEQYPAVGVASGNQGQIFLERQKTDQPEKQQRHVATEGQRQRTQRHNQPPTTNALPQFAI